MNQKSISIILPEEVVRTLTRAEINVADLILDLCRCTSMKSPSKAMFTCVGQAWLAKRVGVTREWISKCVNKLNKLLILDVRRRRKEGGIWKSNIYRVGDLLKMSYQDASKRYKNVKKKYSSHVKKKTYIVYKNKHSSTTIRKQGLTYRKESDKSFEDIIAMAMQSIEATPD